MNTVANMVASVIAVSTLAGVSNIAVAGPLCSDMMFPVPLESFVSCVAGGMGAAGQDNLPNVQATLDLALEPNVVLNGIGSFSPGPETSMEFTGDDLANGFDIDPSTVAGSDTFTFNQIPPDTQFISLKQGNDFEIFKVAGPTPFTLMHQLGGESTSHISTFVPEPSAATLMLLSLVGVGLLRKKESHS